MVEVMGGNNANLKWVKNIVNIVFKFISTIYYYILNWYTHLDQLCLMSKLSKLL